jgi:sterol desaturase/sphingolipid hydroxylase (fatty acid hydroxylase superfamily)
MASTQVKESCARKTGKEEEEDARKTIAWYGRIGVALLCFSLFANASFWDSLVALAYTSMKEWHLFDGGLWIEPLCVILSFPLFIGAFNVIDCHFHSLHRYRVLGASQKPTLAPSWRRASLNPLSILKKVALYSIPVALFELLTGVLGAERLRGAPIVPPECAPSARELAFGVVAALFVYDALFSVGHFCLHRVRWLYRWHARHHRRATIQAADALELSLVEATGEVLVSIAALYLTGAHRLTRVVYDIVIVYLLVELHSGYDFPLSLGNLFPRVFLGPRQHFWHHRHGSRFFGKFFALFDHLFGTFDSD